MTCQGIIFKILNDNHGSINNKLQLNTTISCYCYVDNSWKNLNIENSAHIENKNNHNFNVTISTQRKCHYKGQILSTY